MQRNRQRVDIFWDFKSARALGQVSGYSIAKEIRELANSYGLIRSFRVYLDIVKQQCPNFPVLKRELHASGVSLVDCPSISKDVTDKAIIVDMLTLAMDEEPPHSILVATGDQDLSNALAVLRLRGFKIILLYPAGTQQYLLMQSDERFSWHSQILGQNSDTVDLSPSSLSSVSSPSPSSHSEIYCTTTSFVNGDHSSAEACSAQADSHLKSATSRFHYRGFSLDVSSDVDAKLRRSNEDDAADLSLVTLPAPSAPQSPSLLTGPLTSGTTKFDAKVQASTISGGGLFPPPSLEKLTIFDQSELKAEALAVSEVTATPNSIQPKQKLHGALAIPAVSAADTVHLPVTQPSDTSAPENTKVTTPHVANHIEASACSVLGTSPPSSLSATTKCQPTNPSSHPVPIISASGPASLNPTGSTPSSLKAGSKSRADPSTNVVSQKFVPLVRILQPHGCAGVKQDQISKKIIQLYPRVYVDAGVQKWKRYVVKAVAAGIISKKGDLISLQKEWLNSKINP